MRSLWNWTGRLAILIALLPMLAVPATAVAQGEGSTAGEEKSEEESGTKSEAGGASEEVAAPGFDTGDTAWMMVSCALVLMMTAPGLALFYGGLVRKKNILGVMMQCFFLMGLMSVVWALWGYSFAFGGESPYIGSLTQHAFLSGVIPFVNDAGAIVVPVRESTPNIPHSLFMMFQGPVIR